MKKVHQWDESGCFIWPVVMEVSRGVKRDIVHMPLMAGACFQQCPCVLASKPLGFSGRWWWGRLDVAFCPVMPDAVKRKMGMSRAGRGDWELFHMEELRVNGPISANSHLGDFKLGIVLVFLCGCIGDRRISYANTKVQWALQIEPLVVVLFLGIGDNLAL